MKQFLPSTVMALCLALNLPAGPLQKNQVPATAKWVLHLDIEAALRSQIGGFVAKELVDRQLSRPMNDLKTKHGLEADWRKIQSITVYGTEFGSRPDQDGVLLVHSSLDLPALLDKLVEDLGATGLLTREKQANGRARYSLHEEVHGAAGPDGVFALSKSSSRLDDALAVLEGKGTNLTASKAFSRLPAVPEGFIFLGLAEGFNTASVPQARMLKQSDGGQFVAGEKAGQLFATLNLSTKDAEAAGQIQQVLQGLLALGSMNQPDNKDLQRLIQATKVTTNNTMVSVNVELPASNVIQHVTRELRKRGE